MHNISFCEFLHSFDLKIILIWKELSLPIQIDVFPKYIERAMTPIQFSIVLKELNTFWEKKNDPYSDKYCAL